MLAEVALLAVSFYVGTCMDLDDAVAWTCQPACAAPAAAAAIATAAAGGGAVVGAAAAP